MPKFTFHTTHMVKIGEHTYRPTTVDVVAEDVEKAYEQALPQFPDGSRLFCWISDERVPESDSLDDEV